LTASQLTALITVLSTTQIASMPTAQIAALGTSQIAALSTAQTRALSTTSISILTTDQIAAFETSDIAALTTSQIRTFGTDDIQALTSAQLQALTTNQVAALSTVQVVALTTEEIVNLTTGQVRALSTSAVAALTTDQIVAMETQDLAALKTAQVRVFSTATIQALSTDQIIALTTAQVAAITTAGIAALSTDQMDAMSCEQFAGMTNAQQSAFSGAQIGHIKFGAPLVLDLNGDGVRTISYSAGTQFDLFDSGYAVQTGWVAPEDGLLVLDRNHDGAINSGAELFGSATSLANGEKAVDGYAALAELDSNADGVIDYKDSLWADLGVWTDSNADGMSQGGEIHRLDALDIKQLSLNAEATSVKDNGNWIGLSSSYQTNDGTTHAMADVWFVADPKQAGPDLPSRVSHMAQTINSVSAEPLGQPKGSELSNSAKPPNIAASPFDTSNFHVGAMVQTLDAYAGKVGSDQGAWTGAQGVLAAPHATPISEQLASATAVPPAWMAATPK